MQYAQALTQGGYAGVHGPRLPGLYQYFKRQTVIAALPV